MKKKHFTILNCSSIIMKIKMITMILQKCYTKEKAPRNILDAIKYYELANTFGHKLASYNLGDIYYEGNDVDQDYKKAKKYYEVFINLNRDTEKL